MSDYNLCHIVPDPRIHGLYGYREIIETIGHGLTRLGHAVSYATNEIKGGATNMVFGAQMLQPDHLAQLAGGTVIYNLEQLRGVPTGQLKPAFHHMAARRDLRIWDYSAANLDSWRALGRDDAANLMVSYAPVLTRIAAEAEPDIDVLMYGMSGQERLEAFNLLSRRGLRAAFFSGLYGEARDRMIARSKLVLNVPLYTGSLIFEIPRVSYLFANRRAVVSQVYPASFVEPDLADEMLRAEGVEAVVALCERLVFDDAARAQTAGHMFEVFSRRDIVEALAAVI